ncbi:hypothetical protein D3C80_1673170 [compost metagenome]
MAVARPMPTAFCTRMKMVMMNRNSTRAAPPSRSLAKLALKPIDAKKMSMKPVCKSLLNVKE